MKPTFSTSLGLSSAVKRLYSDLAELLQDPVWRASALPLADDIFEWHANICGPKGSAFEDTPLHVIIKFSVQYPSKPPVVRLGTSIIHPNVIGKRICLDMLEEGGWEYSAHVPYTGWSSAYGVSALLRQLQVFLLDRSSAFEHRADDAGAARDYQCSTCQHKGSAPWPPMTHTNKIIEARILKDAPKLVQYSKSMDRLLNRLRGEEDFREKEQEHALPGVEDVKAANENQKPNMQVPKNGLKIGEGQQVCTSTTEQSPNVVLAAVPVTPAQGPKKKKQKPKAAKAKQQSNQTKPKVPAAGFVIEEECVTPVQEKKQKKSPPSYVDQLIKETIQKEKEKQVKAQENKAKRAQKKQAAAKAEQKQQQVTDVPPSVAPVTTDTYASKVTPVKSVISQSPAPRGQEPEAGEEHDIGEAQSLSDMPYDVLLNVIQYISWTDLTSMACVNYKLSTITQESHVWKTLCMKYLPSAPSIIKNFMKDDKSTQGNGVATTWRSTFLRGREFVKNELRCFHTKLSFEDDVLGIPLNVTFGEGKNNWISEISTTFDIVSRQAYTNDRVRKACWKQPFQFWLPIYINSEHASRATPHFQASVTQILGSPFNLNDVLVILPKLMSTMVVELSNQKSHASMKALEGYCWFHRWFLEYVTKYPSVRAGVNNRIASFIRDPSFRTKKNTPSLGEWICLLSVSDKYKWSDVSAAYINESFDRNAKWSLEKFPELQHRQLPCESRMIKTFEGCLVSIRLLMFHVFFLDFVKPRGLSLERIKEEYDAFYGMLSHSQKETFQKGVFDILQIDNWEDFLHNIKLKTIPTEDQFEKILINAILNSYCKGYHKVSTEDRCRVDLIYWLLK